MEHGVQTKKINTGDGRTQEGNKVVKERIEWGKYIRNKMRNINN